MSNIISKKFNLTIDIKDKTNNIIPPMFQIYNDDSTILNISVVEDNQPKILSDCNISILYLIDGEILLEQSTVEENGGINIIDETLGSVQINIKNEVVANPSQRVNCILRIFDIDENVSSTMFSFRILETMDYKKTIEAHDDIIALRDINNLIDKSNDILDITNQKIETFKDNIIEVNTDLDDIKNKLNNDVEEINNKINNINSGIEESVVRVNQFIPTIVGNNVYFSSANYDKATDLIGRSFIIKIKGCVDTNAITNSCVMIISFCEDVDVDNNNKSYIKCTSTTMLDTSLTNGRKVSPSVLFNLDDINYTTIYSDSENIKFSIKTNFKKEYIRYDSCNIIEF